jgi:hypothetical protein
MAFGMCNSLRSVTFTGGPQVFSGYLFANASSLTTVVLSDKTIAIEDKAFQNCEQLKELFIPASVVSIHPGAFLDMSHPVKIVTPYGSAGYDFALAKGWPLEITDMVIEDGVFKGYSGNKTEISLPPGVTSVGVGAFKNNTALTTVRLPESTTSIQSRAFAGCTSLRAVYLSQGILFIADDAFEGLSPAAITLYDNFTPYVLRYALLHGFELGGAIEFIINPNTSALIRYNGNAASVTIPSGVRRIAANAFKTSPRTTTITIPASVLAIDEAAFAGLMLDRLTIKAPWGSVAQQYATSHAIRYLSTDYIVDENGVLTGLNPEFREGRSAFVVPWDVTGIRPGVFAGSQSVVRVDLLDTRITSLEGTFAGCSNLLAVTLPPTLKVIGSQTFAYTGALFLTIPSSVTTIGQEAFRSSLISYIDVPSSVRSIGYRAFYDTFRLDTALFHTGLKSIEAEAFAGSALKAALLPEGLESLGRAAFASAGAHASRLAEVYIPGSLKVIADYAFNDCNQLKKVTISEGVERIGTQALGGNSSVVLDDLVIPASVTYIGEWAFRNQGTLKTLTVLGNPTMILNALEGGRNNTLVITYATSDKVIHWAVSNRLPLQLIGLYTGSDEVSFEYHSAALPPGARGLHLEVVEITAASVGADRQVYLQTLQSLEDADKVLRKLYRMRIVDENGNPVEPVVPLTVRIKNPDGELALMSLDADTGELTPVDASYFGGDYEFWLGTSGYFLLADDSPPPLLPGDEPGEGPQESSDPGGSENPTTPVSLTNRGQGFGTGSFMVGGLEGNGSTAESVDVAETLQPVASDAPEPESPLFADRDAVLIGGAQTDLMANFPWMVQLLVAAAALILAALIVRVATRVRKPRNPPEVP